MDIKVLVVGLHHHNDNLVFDCGMPVSVVFDDHNEHSDNAFKVLTEGGLFGGYLAESERFWGSLAQREGAILSKELKELIDEGYSINSAVVEEIRGRTLKTTKIMVKMTLTEPEITSEEVIEEMEEDNMDIEVIGSKKGLYTLVGVQYHVDNIEIGTEVELRIINNTTFGYTSEGEPLGVFPQKDVKCDSVIRLGLPLERNSEIKNNAVAFEREYVVVGFIAETKGNKVSKYAVLQLKSVVEATEEDKEELYMERTIAYGFNKMGELKTLYDVENIVEEVIEETTNVEPVKAGESTLKQRIEEIKASINVKETELNQLKADLEMYEKELSAVEYRNSLITEIKANIFGLETEDIEAIHRIVMADVPSSTPEEDVSSSFNEEINNNGVKMEEKYDYSIVFEKGDEEVVKLANEINDILIQMVDDSPLKGEPTMFDISDINKNTVYARLDFNMADLETPNLEKKVCDVIRTILMEKHVIFSMDTMPNVDAEEQYYYYPIKIKK